MLWDVATLGRRWRDFEPDARPKSVNVRRLSELVRDPSREKVRRDATGLRGMVKHVDGRDSIDSDRALVNTCAGCSDPTSSPPNMGKAGSWLPGR